ncbi:PBS lyase HEAT domain protein repeat-containing protein [Anaeromyxobacter sp. K]|uniref:HEAT repeat domain-containing protein n=1 Tax=Anaeromyxobacter sp. (strain K) TaxID=447217 RepID=UPI00015F9336|nr:HEAT repeat domain-containing protein [Anaeromyxobacter sp. K]ACG74824.1 PBS lyase HEAT domain protein repeat-containing protein [Anaeromyxobacter sp. K]
MAFAGAFEPVVRAAWATGLLTALLSAVLVARVLGMRRRLARAETRRQDVVARWRPILFEAIAGGSPHLPALPPEDEDAFLLLWVQLLDGIRGEPLERLARVGDALGAGALAAARLRREDALGHVLALRTLGYLGRAEDRAEVLRWLDDPRSYLSLAAARALVRIDPEGAPAELLPRLARRGDWPVPLFASVLGEASPPRVSERFAALCAALPGPALVRLLPLASIVDAHRVEPILAALLERADEPEVLAAALRQVRSPELLDAARRAARHASWSVRVQAAAALGRVGERADRELLAGLLRDAEWWVRYRAAQALAARPYGTSQEVLALAEASGDRYARDIVRQALAEVRS